MHIRRVIEVGRFDGYWNYGCHHSHNGWPCGKCVACRKRWSKDWIVRLNEERNYSVSCHFFTLTYNDYFVPCVEPYEYDVYDHNKDHVCKATASFTPDYPSVLVVRKKDVQLMLKRMRKYYDKQGIKFRYFIISEYGPKTYRPHYHGIIFFDKYVGEVIFHDSLFNCWCCPDSKMSIGNIETSLITAGRIQYVAKYATTLTQLPEHLQVKEYKPFMLSSRRGGGIGSQYAYDEKNIRYHRTTLDKKYVLHNYDTNKNYSYSLPRFLYYKMFDALERLIMARLRIRRDKFKAMNKEEDRRNNYEQYGNTNVFSFNPITDIPLPNDYYLSLIYDEELKTRTKNNKRKNF